MPVRFIKLLFIFLVPVLLVFAGIEYLLSSVDNIYTIKKRMLEQHADSLEVLIVGTSQAFHSLNPAVFNRPALNLAAPAQPLYYDCKITLSYLPRLKKLRLVIIPVDYISLFFNADKAFNYQFYYSRFWKLDNPTVRPTDFTKYSLLAFYKPVTARQMLIQMIKEKNTHIRFDTNGMLDNGFTALPVPADTSGFEKTAVNTISRWHTMLMSEKNFAGNAQRLENLVAILEKKNIKVLLLSTPVIQNFYKKYERVYSRMNAGFINQLTSKHSNIKYADFTTDARFTIDDFFNPNHLNKNGAIKFSYIIRHDYIDHMIP